MFFILYCGNCHGVTNDWKKEDCEKHFRHYFTNQERDDEELVLEMALGMKRMWWSQQNLLLQLSLGSDGALDSTVTLNILKPCNLEENGQTRSTGGVSCMRIIITG